MKASAKFRLDVSIAENTTLTRAVVSPVSGVLGRGSTSGTQSSATTAVVSGSGKPTAVSAIITPIVQSTSGQAEASVRRIEASSASADYTASGTPPDVVNSPDRESLNNVVSLHSHTLDVTPAPLSSVPESRQPLSRVAVLTPLSPASQPPASLKSTVLSKSQGHTSTTGLQDPRLLDASDTRSTTSRSGLSVMRRRIILLNTSSLVS